jgi:hypothetical protein
MGQLWVSFGALAQGLAKLRHYAARPSRLARDFAPANISRAIFFTTLLGVFRSIFC